MTNLVTTKDYDTSQFDWGRATKDYLLYRPPPPTSFYNKLRVFGIGIKGQQLLDLGTGIGYLATEFAKQGCVVSAVDISAAQIECAKAISHKLNLNINYITSSAEDVELPKKSFDVVTAMQCWLYFKKREIKQKINLLLKDNGKLMVSNFDHLPAQSKLVQITEELMKKFNNAWDQADWHGNIQTVPSWIDGDLKLSGMFVYDEDIPFTRESWCGRIVASQAIAAQLPIEQVNAFKKELMQHLNFYAPERFTIPHRISAHIVTKKINEDDYKL